jgi:hypothetical protein
MSLYGEIASFIDRLDDPRLIESSVLGWACPVPFFGQLDGATVATVGINPSNREFLAEDGTELPDVLRRLPTLRSLGLASWTEARAIHIREIVTACTEYFSRNPYDRWFRVLDGVLIPMGASLYGDHPKACHLDLMPYATTVKWGALPRVEQSTLLSVTQDALGLMLRTSSIETLILNGRTVVEHFEALTGVTLEVAAVDAWQLSRVGRSPVPGVAYWGEISEIGAIPLDRTVRVAGFNHNLQSSFGVTRRALSAIGTWLGAMGVVTPQ